MPLNDMTSYEKLHYALKLLDHQDLSALPRAMQIELLTARQLVYGQLQFLNASPIMQRTAHFKEVKSELEESRETFEKLDEWSRSAQETGKTVESLIKGVAAVLALL